MRVLTTGQWCHEASEVTVPCELCNRATRMTGTRRCDRCYELESRIRQDPKLARDILAKLKK